MPPKRRKHKWLKEFFKPSTSTPFMGVVLVVISGLWNTHSVNKANGNLLELQKTYQHQEWEHQNEVLQKEKLLDKRMELIEKTTRALNMASEVKLLESLYYEKHDIDAVRELFKLDADHRTLLTLDACSFGKKTHDVINSIFADEKHIWQTPIEKRKEFLDAMINDLGSFSGTIIPCRFSSSTLSIDI